VVDLLFERRAVKLRSRALGLGAEEADAILVRTSLFAKARATPKSRQHADECRLAEGFAPPVWLAEHHSSPYGMRRAARAGGGDSGDAPRPYRYGRRRAPFAHRCASPRVTMVVFFRKGASISAWDAATSLPVLRAGISMEKTRERFDENLS
jgi:hypothetical protein